MKRVILKLTSDILQKLAIVGIALGIFQDKADGIWWALAFLALATFWLYGRQGNELVDSLHYYWNRLELRGDTGKFPAQRLNRPQKQKITGRLRAAFFGEDHQQLANESLQGPVLRLRPLGLRRQGIRICPWPLPYTLVGKSVVHMRGQPFLHGRWRKLHLEQRRL